MQTQNELNRKSDLRKSKNKSEKKRVYCGQYALSNVLVCSEFGDLYRRVALNNQASTSAKWRCATRITDGPEVCKGGSLEESEIQNAVLRALNQTFAGKNNVKEVLKKNVLDIDKNDNSKQMSLVDEKINKLQMKQVSSVQDNKSYDQIVEQLEELRNNKSKLQTDKSIVDANKRRIVDLIKFIDASSFRVEEYEDKLYNRN